MENNKNENNEFQEIQIMESTEMVQQIESAQIDIQIETAKRFPRNTKKCLDDAIAIVTMDSDTAKSCGYSLKFRGGKPIEGKSIHLAKIVAQCWGNLRYEKRIIGADTTHVLSEGTCFDLERNIAHRVQVKKPIIKKEGGRYSADMIAVTGMAAASIAMREAILAIVPKNASDKIYQAARDTIAGKISNKNELIKRRKSMLDYFKNNYNIDEKQVLKYLEIKTSNQITKDHIIDLIGLDNSIKEGEVKLESIFELPVDEEKNKKLRDLFEGDEAQQPE